MIYDEKGILLISQTLLDLILAKKKNIDSERLPYLLPGNGNGLGEKGSSSTDKPSHSTT